ncbi:MAG TPA: SDR family NAD(P)-dependent oxidoreductase [Candidatus Angelobacter sp.]|nr:SDR family NAD(P)-dependent oxidoreductase [Candidatus Angelobacter sp.]
MSLADSGTAIAVVGMSGRFPGARNLEQFWENLCGGVESIRNFRPEELTAAGIGPELQAKPEFVNAGAPLDDAEMFDAAFFGVSAREAQALDPQRRVFLECAWHALEDAACVPESANFPISVFAGTSASTYLYRLYSDRALVAAVGGFQVMIGNDKDHLATQLAYKLNLKGPAVTVQTACSTSLVAVALACQSLLIQECDLAVAGGTSINFPQQSGYFFESGGILSPDGHCRPFDEHAMGTLPGNGTGVVVLKRMADALRDGDRIRAVILGSAINNDGAGKVGYTAPSADGQAAVVATALALANVSADTISYLEAHGTGTPLGDPIEIAALTQAFRADTHRSSFCAIGSVKSNIGHLDAAAGIAGFIKTVLCLENKQIPPSLNFSKPNPVIPFKSSPFYVQGELAEWKNGSGPRRAGISSFGIGGTNAHAVLQEAPAAGASGPSRKLQLLPISARTGPALDQAAVNLLDNLRSHPLRPLADVAFTLATGRRGFAQRRYLLAGTTEQAIRQLQDAQGLRTAEAENNSQVAFLFPGQGSQYAGMGKELYEEESGFRAEVDRCAEILLRRAHFDIRDELFGADAAPEVAPEAANDRLRETRIAQPALFTIEYALARLLISWGIVPKAMLGHSLGEYVAACLAGVFSLPDALAVVAERGKLMQETARGAMLAASLSESEALQLLSSRPSISLAAVNGSSQCVFSGDAAAIAELEQILIGQNALTSRIPTSHAFHSASMDPVLEEFRKVLKSVAMKPPSIPYVSNLTGKWQTDAATDPNYWVQHLRQTVRFADGAAELCQNKFRIQVEVGPGHALGALLRPLLREAGAGAAIPAMRDKKEIASDAECLTRALGEIWLGGGAISWNNYYAKEQRQRVALPGYPFEHKRYDVEVSTTPAPQVFGKNPDIGAWFYLPSWRQTPPAIAGDLTGPFAIFSDGLGLGESIAAKLREANCEVVTVEIGEQFQRYSEQRFAVRPNSVADHAELLRSLSAEGKLPQRFLHLWNISDSAAAVGVGFESLHCFAQALCAYSDPMDVLVVSNHLQSVTGDEAVHAEKAAILGICRVLPLERMNIRCRSLDVSWPSEGVVAQVIAELAHQGFEALVAYRGRRRWVETVEYAPLAAAEPPLRKHGVYLITGGFGGIGLALAEHLATEYQARLVLVGRNLPKEDSPVWPRLQAMEEAGAEVMACPADICDENKMRASLQEFHTRFGPLHGVIHSAGVAGGGVIEIKEKEIADRVLAPKVKGTLVLHELLKDEPLDFFVCCSSLAALLGGAGQADYCGANSFLDAYAHREAHRSGRITVSMNWDTWSEAGMAVETAVPSGMEALRAEALRNGILSAEGVAAFRRALAARLPQICISTLPLALRIEQNRILLSGNGAESQSTPAMEQNRHARPEMRSPFVAPSTDVERSLASIWETLLGIDGVGVHDHFLELGGHSLLAIQLVSRIRSAFGVEATVREIFESPTIAGLASLIERRVNESEELARLLGDLEGMSDAEVKAQLHEGGE